MVQSATGHLTLLLIEHLTEHKRSRIGAVYLELLSRTWDEGFLVIKDEMGHAFRSGFRAERAVRSWRAHVKALHELGFINVKPNGNREIGAILLVDPMHVVDRLSEKGKVPERILNSIMEVCMEFRIPVSSKKNNSKEPGNKKVKS